MQKTHFYLLFTILVLVFLSCTVKLTDKSEPISLSGVLVVVGNEPFTSYAIDDKEGTITRLKLSDKQLMNINNWQGIFIIVKGTKFSVLDELIVDSIEILTKGDVHESQDNN